MFSSGFRTLKDMRVKNEKIVIKSKNTTKEHKDNKGDKFFDQQKEKTGFLFPLLGIPEKLTARSAPAER